MHTENLKKAFSFPFEDEEWLPKLGMHVLLMIGGVLIVPALFAAGYTIEIRRRIILNREEPSLPDWENWDVLLIDGLKMMFLSIIAMLPASLFWFGAYILPMLILPFSALFDDWGFIFTLLPVPLVYIGMALAMLFYLVGIVYLLVATDHMIAKGDFTAAFRFKELWCVFRNNFMGYILVFLLTIGLTVVLSMISQILIFTVVLCCLAYPIMFVASTYLMMVSSALYAQVYVEGADLCTASQPAEGEKSEFVVIEEETYDRELDVLADETDLTEVDITTEVDQE